MVVGTRFAHDTERKENETERRYGRSTRQISPPSTLHITRRSEGERSRIGWPTSHDDDVREGKGKVEEKASQGYWLLKDTQLVFIYFCYFDELHSFCTRRRIDFISHTFLYNRYAPPTRKNTHATIFAPPNFPFLFFLFCFWSSVTPLPMSRLFLYVLHI